MQNKRFEGIKPAPNPKPNPDGSYTVTLTVTQWKVFQDNQKKPPVPVPAEPAQPTSGEAPNNQAPGKDTEKSPPDNEPEKKAAKPKKKPSEKITIEKDFRMSKHYLYSSNCLPFNHFLSEC